MTWQVTTRESAQAGNRASKTEHYLQWLEYSPEWNAVTPAMDKLYTCSFLCFVCGIWPARRNHLSTDISRVTHLWASGEGVAVESQWLVIAPNACAIAPQCPCCPAPMPLLSLHHAPRIALLSPLKVECLGGCVSVPFDFAGGHTASNTPDLFRPPKLSGAGPG